MRTVVTADDCYTGQLLKWTVVTEDDCYTGQLLKWTGVTPRVKILIVMEIGCNGNEDNRNSGQL